MIDSKHIIILIIFNKNIQKTQNQLNLMIVNKNNFKKINKGQNWKINSVFMIVIIYINNNNILKHRIINLNKDRIIQIKKLNNCHRKKILKKLKQSLKLLI